MSLTLSVTHFDSANTEEKKRTRDLLSLFLANRSNTIPQIPNRNQLEGKTHTDSSLFS